jgi:lysophospholipase L1-like esterase
MRPLDQESRADAGTGEATPKATRMRKARVGFLATVAGLILTLTTGIPVSAATPMGSGSQASYVALGDSFTSGDGIPTQLTDPPGCAQSDRDYPHLLAPQLNLPVFRDASCSGATTHNLTEPQGLNPPQLDRLDADTKIVTLGIGGNDIGFDDIAFTCLITKPCQPYWVTDGIDRISARIQAAGGAVAAALQGIRDRSPNAVVYVLGYEAILPTQGPGCSDIPFDPADVPFLRAKHEELNAKIKEITEAAGHGFVYVDTYSPSTGRDACQPPGTRWVEPLFASGAAPLHPNAEGMEAKADQLRRLILGSAFPPQPRAAAASDPTSSIPAPRAEPAAPVRSQPRFTG